MPSVSLAPTFGCGYQAFDSNGLPLNAGKLYTYAAGGTTPQATYTTSVGNVQNDNPVTLSADGRPPSEIWLLTGSAYRFDLKDSAGNLIKTYDNVKGINDVSSVAVPLTGGTIAGSLTVTTGPVTVNEGTALAPVTLPDHAISVIKYENIASPAAQANPYDGSNAAIFSYVSGASTNDVQVVPIYGYCGGGGDQAGADLVAVMGWSRLTNNVARISTGGYFEGRKDYSVGYAVGAELRGHNQSGVADTFVTSGASQSMGVWATTNGNANCAVAMNVGWIASGTSKWLVGYGAVGDSVVNQTFRDHTNAITSLYIHGSHQRAFDYLGNLSGTVNTSAIIAEPTIKSDVTGVAALFVGYGITEAAAFTLTALRHFSAKMGTVGAGSAITTQSGFYVDSAMTGAGTNIGFHGNLAAATNDRNVYIAGTAPNYFRSNVGINSNVFGTNADCVLSLGTGTAPADGPADTVQLYSTDIAPGHTELSIRCEGTQVLATGQPDSVSSVRVKMRINGTEVTLLAI